VKYAIVGCSEENRCAFIEEIFFCAISGTMNFEKSVLMQKQVRDNSDDIQKEFLDLKNWEEQMKRKERELLSEKTGEVFLKT